LDNIASLQWFIEQSGRAGFASREIV